MKLQINITKEILRESMFCKSNASLKSSMIGQNCAIGKAIYKLFGKRSWVASLDIYIFPFSVPFEDSNEVEISIASYTLSLPLEAIKFIKQFDKLSPKERATMTPFSFTIDVPDELINEIGISEVEEILSKSPTLERVDLALV